MRCIEYAVIVGILCYFAVPVASASGYVPYDDSPRGYLHCDNEENAAGYLWINAVSDDNDSAASNHQTQTSPGFEGFDYGFPVRESNQSDTGLEDDMYFEEEDSVASFRVRIEFASGSPSEIVFSLREDNDAIDSVTLDYTATGIYTGDFDIPGEYVIDEGTALSLRIDWTLSTGDNEWTIYMNDESYIDLPIAPDFDNDGEPDYLDDDDDGDGYTDDEEVAAGTDPQHPDDYPGVGGGNGGDDGDDDAFPGFEAPMVVAGIACIILLRRRR